ncbi:hypothetical protein OH77DRAFT_1023851 [Trametes cingulata]|nr:hypothetical protein OH77DRAFT_1023851 [Trametes cingulata]
MSGDKLIEFVCQACKLMILHEMIMTDPDASEEHQTSLSAWTGEVLCEVQDVLKRVDSGEINFENLWNLVEFLEELVEVHTLARLLVHSDFVIALRNFIDRVKSRPGYDENDSRLGYWIRRCKTALQELESKLQSDIPAPSATETHASAGADLASTPQARPSEIQSVCEQSEEQVSGPANSSDAVKPASLVTTSSPAGPPVNSPVVPAFASQSPPSESVDSEEHMKSNLGPVHPSYSDPRPEPTSFSVSALVNSSPAPASASHSTPSEPVHAQSEGKADPASLSGVDDPRPASASSSDPSLSAPLTSDTSDTNGRPSPSSSGQDEKRGSLSKKVGYGADTASVLQTPPWHPVQDEANGRPTTGSDPIEPRDDAARGSASARPSCPPT